MRTLLTLIVIVLMAGAGCLGGVTDTVQPPAHLADAIPEQPIVQTHDHTDASLHTGHANMEFVAWNPLIPDELGEEGFAGMRIVNGVRLPEGAGPDGSEGGVADVAFIGTDGAHAGFVTVDVSDPRDPKLLGQYVTDGGASQEAVPTWDGKWVFMNLQSPLGPTEILDSPEEGTGLGIHVVNVEDPTNPTFESFFPVEAYGTHVMYYYEWDGEPYLVYNGQPLRQGLPDGSVYTPPAGNVVHIAKFVEVNGVHTLQPVSEYRYEPSLTATNRVGCFPHDMWVEKHPVTEQEVMYVSHWDCGMVTVDVTDPAMPVTLGAYDDPAPSTRNEIHFTRPDPTLRDERVIAYSAPEIGQSPGESGLLRAYDVTDPATPAQIGWWELPGDVENDQPYVFTPHNFDFHGDLLALAHYHAGVWVLDVSEPENPLAVGYYLPHGEHDHPYEGEVWRKTPNFPEAYFPNVYEAKWHTSSTDGEVYLLVTERGSGLYVLRFTGA